MGTRVTLQDRSVAYAIDVDTFSRREDAAALRNGAEIVRDENGKTYFRIDQENCCGRVLKIVAVALLVFLSAGILGIALCVSSRVREYFLGRQIQIVDQDAYDRKNLSSPPPPSPPPRPPRDGESGRAALANQSPPRDGESGRAALANQSPPRDGESGRAALANQIRERGLLRELGFTGVNASHQFSLAKDGNVGVLTGDQLGNVEQMQKLILNGNKAMIGAQLVLRWIREGEGACGCFIDLCVQDPSLLRAGVETNLALQLYLRGAEPASEAAEEQIRLLTRIRLLIQTVFERRMAIPLPEDSVQRFEAQQERVDAMFNEMLELDGRSFDPLENSSLLNFMFFDASAICYYAECYGVQVLAYVPVEKLRQADNLNMRIPVALKGAEPARQQIDVANAAFRRAGYPLEQCITVIHWQMGRPTTGEGASPLKSDERAFDEGGPQPLPRD